MPKFEYTPLEQSVQGLGDGWFKDLLLSFVYPKWQPPTAPTIDRNLDRSKVTAVTEFNWAPELKDLKIKTEPPTTLVWQNAMYGMPLQRVAVGAQTVEWTEWDTIANGSPGAPAVRTVMVPVPVDGEWWPEEGPQIGGGSDKHVILYRPETQEAWELIGATPGLKMALKVSYWQKETIAKGDIPVCAANRRMTSIMRQRGDKGAVIGLVMNNYHGADGDMAPNSGWPTCGRRYAISSASYAKLIKAHEKDEECLAFLKDGKDHGFFIYDRSRQLSPTAIVGYYGGAQWRGNTLGKINLTMKDLVLVTATT